MISVRTFINTTFFWIFAFVIFWWYTQWIDNTPAKEFLHFIQRDDMGNLTITTNERLSVGSEWELLDKLDRLERMIQATNMTCSEQKLLTSQTTYLQPTLNPQSTSSAPTPGEQASSTTTQETQIALAVFNSTLNDTLDPAAQYTSAALVELAYSLDTAHPDVREVFDLIKQPPLSAEQRTQGREDLFAQSTLSLQGASIQDWSVLELRLGGGEELSEPEQQLFRVMLEQTYNQFSGITSVIVQR